MSRLGGIQVADDAPDWLAQTIENVVAYVQAYARGPQQLTAYTAANLPDATAFRRSLIYNGTTNLPRFSDASGNWTDLVASTAALTALLAMTFASGTYVPTLTNTANVSSSTALQCQYMRVGSVVTVSGGVTLTPTLLANVTTIGITLPIASNIANPENLGGAANSASVASASAAIFGDAANDRATMQMISVGTGAETFYFSFTYLVI